jgi:hypothetical protein
VAPAAHTELVISATKKILEDALALPEKEQEAPVEALSDSLHPEAVELSPEWTSEIRERIAKIESDPLERGRRPHQEVLNAEVMLLERLNLGSNQRPHAPKSQKTGFGRSHNPLKNAGNSQP